MKSAKKPNPRCSKTRRLCEVVAVVKIDYGYITHSLVGKMGSGCQFMVAWYHVVRQSILAVEVCLGRAIHFMAGQKGESKTGNHPQSSVPY